MKRFFDLAKLRNEKGLTQTELALKLNISQTDVSNYENDTGSIPFYVLIKLAKIFDIHNLEDFFNVQQSVLPVEVDDYFKDIRTARDKKLKIFYGIQNLDFITALHLFFIERPLYQQFHKPLIVIIDEFIEEAQDFASAIIGNELPFPEDNILTFIASNEEKPLFITEDEYVKEFPHFANDVLYFRKTKSYFDISLSKCPFYTCCIPKNSSKSDWDDPYVDLFLNTTDIKDSQSSIVFSDSQLLNNCNILLLSSNNAKAIKEYSSMANLILTLKNKKNIIKVSLQQSEKDKIVNYDFSFSNNDINTNFYKAINSSLKEECSKISKTAEEGMVSYLKLLNKIFTKNKQLYSMSETARNKIYSQTLILKNDIETLLNTEKNKTIEDFDREYSTFIDVKNLENIFIKLGKETHKDSLEEQELFPCNTKDLEKAKNTLFDSLSEIISDLVENGNNSFLEKFSEKCKGYEFEPYLQETISELLRGMDLGASENSSEYEEGFNIFLSNTKGIYKNTSSIIDSIDNSIEDDDFEKIFYEALKDIVTFSRGFTLSKARKFSKSLQTFQTHNAFINYLNKQWELIEALYMSIMQDCFGEVFYLGMPKTPGDIKQQEKELEILETLIEELKK